MDLEQIRTKLNHQAKMQPPAASHVPADWPKIQLSRPGGSFRQGTPRPTQPRELVNVVETLQRREEAYGTPLQSRATTPQKPSSATSADTTWQEVEIHIKRLQSLAEKINSLSYEQEHLMGEIKAVESRLGQLQLQGHSPSQGGVPLPKIHLDRAVLASAETDGAANLVITYRSPHLPHPEHDAHVLADHLRGAYGPKPQASWQDFWARLMQEMDMVWQEPATLIARGWQQAQSLNRTMAHAASSQDGGARSAASPAAAWSALSLVDMLVWFGGGVIGRLALNLVLSAIPALWALAVAILTGITAYALYRATLAPRKDFGIAYRVFLMIGGLMIGGYF
jgi:hypothetical protein